jgi:hypothetical protein
VLDNLNNLTASSIKSEKIGGDKIPSFQSEETKKSFNDTLNKEVSSKNNTSKSEDSSNSDVNESNKTDESNESREESEDSETQDKGNNRPDEESNIADLVANAELDRQEELDDVEKSKLAFADLQMKPPAQTDLNNSDIDTELQEGLSKLDPELELSKKATNKKDKLLFEEADVELDIDSEKKTTNNDAIIKNIQLEKASNLEVGNLNQLRAAEMKSDISDSKWGDEFSQKVHVLINSKTKEAKISMNPRELGSIKVRVEQSDNDLKLSFTSATSRVSEVIETNLFKLKDLIQNEGMNLVDVSVSSQDREEQNNDNNKGGRSSHIAQAEEKESSEHVINISDNIIDFYA